MAAHCCFSGRCNPGACGYLSLALQHAVSTGAKQRLAWNLEAPTACKFAPRDMPGLVIGCCRRRFGHAPFEQNKTVTTLQEQQHPSRHGTSSARAMRLRAAHHPSYSPRGVMASGPQRKRTAPLASHECLEATHVLEGNIADKCVSRPCCSRRRASP